MIPMLEMAKYGYSCLSKAVNRMKLHGIQSFLYIKSISSPVLLALQTFTGICQGQCCIYLYDSQEVLLEVITPEIAELVGMRARKYVVDGFRQTPSNYLIAVSWCSGMRVLRRPAIQVRNFIFTRGNEVVCGQAST